MPTDIRDDFFHYIPKCQEALRDIFPLTPLSMNGNSPGPHWTHPWVWLQSCQLSKLCLLLKVCGTSNDSKQLHVVLQGVGLGSKVGLMTEEGLPGLLVYGLYLKQLQMNMWQMLQGLKSCLLHTLQKALSCSGRVLCGTWRLMMLPALFGVVAAMKNLDVLEPDWELKGRQRGKLEIWPLPMAEFIPAHPGSAEWLLS